MRAQLAHQFGRGEGRLRKQRTNRKSGRRAQSLADWQAAHAIRCTIGELPHETLSAAVSLRHAAIETSAADRSLLILRRLFSRDAPGARSEDRSPDLVAQS